MKKYELTNDTINVYGRKLTRIRALKDFAYVKTGDLGGYIESESNLSQDGDCWVSDEAQVFGEAWVSGKAQVLGKAQVFGEAQVLGEAWVFGEAQVFGKAWVYGKAWVLGEARVSGKAQVFDEARVYGEARVFDEAWVCGYEKIYNNKGDMKIRGGMFDKSNQQRTALETPLTNCQHKWSLYQGFTESFEFCTKCDERKA